MSTLYLIEYFLDIALIGLLLFIFLLVLKPLVLGSPNVRFFATAPLRTADGFNIGAYV